MELRGGLSKSKESCKSEVQRESNGAALVPPNSITPQQQTTTNFSTPINQSSTRPSNGAALVPSNSTTPQQQHRPIKYQITGCIIGNANLLTNRLISQKYLYRSNQPIHFLSNALNGQPPANHT
ncbi:hypothetical protein DFA_10513 [Cavenderia fasciculata]|uniref:Uncharacterized protein n=1 Tax=Cavenderia fasciculata TaxID=261658 RepID=F4QAF2_CACFS|nr:uncharacterized protein DFA_10513 [Cavenderia fasciculata]EGG15671.1 hypothetical protein DFA_10513 [Cavenderia fasciculata]|eukprot:XP_004354413.1 hypothetical protein DFA_10513 [Cavenderia fasciculata]